MAGEFFPATLWEVQTQQIEHKEIIRIFPFDASKDTDATLADLDEEKIRDFIYAARHKRNFPLAVGTSPEKLLMHLDLIDDDGRVKNAAILLFGKKPQKYFITSEVKCIQFFGNKVEKPLPAYQIYKGDVFELVDQANSFVMSRLNNWTGTRGGDSASVPTRPELPMEAVQEAIVNAVCHRDYRSNGSGEEMRRNSLEADSRLHAMIAEYCSNRYLRSMLGQLFNQTMPYRTFRNYEGSSLRLSDERRHLIRAIAEKDYEKAAALLDAHIMRGCL